MSLFTTWTSLLINKKIPLNCNETKKKNKRRDQQDYYYNDYRDCSYTLHSRGFEINLSSVFIFVLLNQYLDQIACAIQVTFSMWAITSTW